MKLVNDLEGLGASFQSYADKEKVCLFLVSFWLSCEWLKGFFFFVQIVYDVAVLADKADQAVGAVLTAIASPPHANYVVSTSVS